MISNPYLETAVRKGNVVGSGGLVAVALLVLAVVVAGVVVLDGPLIGVLGGLGGVLLGLLVAGGAGLVGHGGGDDTEDDEGLGRKRGILGGKEGGYQGGGWITLNTPSTTCLCLTFILKGVGGGWD